MSKILAVYPNMNKKDLAKYSVQDLLKEPAVKRVLGTVQQIYSSTPEIFYAELQRFIDSKEDTTEGPANSDELAIEHWPLIKVVRIYTRSDVLSTGAVLVDLPGVHDSNAARAAIARQYMQSWYSHVTSRDEADSII